MPQNLSMQFSNCDGYYHALQKCELEYPIGRFFDYCREYRKQMISCCKKERELSRTANFNAAKKRREQHRSSQNLQEEGSKQSYFK